MADITPISVPGASPPAAPAVDTPAPQLSAPASPPPVASPPSSPPPSPAPPVQAPSPPSPPPASPAPALQNPAPAPAPVQAPAPKLPAPAPSAQQNSPAPASQAAAANVPVAAVPAAISVVVQQAAAPAASVAKSAVAAPIILSSVTLGPASIAASANLPTSGFVSVRPSINALVATGSVTSDASAAAASNSGGSEQSHVNPAAVAVPVVFISVLIAAGVAFLTRRWWAKKRDERHARLFDDLYAPDEKEKRTDSEFWDSPPMGEEHVRSSSDPFARPSIEEIATPRERPSMDRRGRPSFEVLAAPPGLAGDNHVVSYAVRPSAAQVGSVYSGVDVQSMYSIESGAIHDPSQAHLSMADARESVVSSYATPGKPEPPKLTVSAPSEVDQLSLRSQSVVGPSADPPIEPRQSLRQSLRWSSYFSWSGRNSGASQTGQAL